MRFVLRFTAASLCLLPLLAGCSKTKGVKVQGKLLLNGEPVKLLADEEILVTFSRVDATEKDKAAPGAAGAVGEDGSFTIAGADNKGITPGRYYVTVTSQSASGGTLEWEDKGKTKRKVVEDGSDNEEDESNDRFEKLFPADGTSPLIAEVDASGSQTFIIDIGKMTVTRQ